MKLETFLNRHTPHICVRKLVRKRVPMYVRTNRKNKEDEERRRVGGGGEKKSPRPTYKADRRIRLSRAVKARARSLRSDWSAAVHLWRPVSPSFIPSCRPFFLVLSHRRRRSRWRRLIVGAYQMPRIQPMFLFPASSYVFSLFFSLADSRPRAFLFPSVFPFDPLLRSSSPRFGCSRSLSLFPRGEWTFRYSFCAG